MQCQKVTKNGRRCAAHAVKGRKYCYLHDPANGAAVAAARKRGGERRRTPHAGNADAIPKQVRTLADIYAVLDYALAEAVPLENSVQRGRLLVSIAGAFVDALKVGELEERIAALEAAYAAEGKAA